MTLSAHTPEALISMRSRLLQMYLSGENDVHLPDVSYTLNVGRRVLPYRWATVVHTEEELIEKLRTHGRATDIMTGEVHLMANLEPPAKQRWLEVARDGSLTLRRDENRHQPAALMDAVKAWSVGRTVNWEPFHANNGAHRISLPTYPFQRRRHWLDDLAQTQGQDIDHE